jgi:hypothetical protein
MWDGHLMKDLIISVSAPFQHQGKCGRLGRGRRVPDKKVNLKPMYIFKG